MLNGCQQFTALSASFSWMDEYYHFFSCDVLVEPIMVIFKAQQITIRASNSTTCKKNTLLNEVVNFATLKTVPYTDARHACSRHAIFPLSFLRTSAETSG